MASENIPPAYNIDLPENRHNPQTARNNAAKDLAERKLNRYNLDSATAQKLKDNNIDIEQFMDAANEALSQLNIQLDFTLDEDRETVIVKVIDRETKDVIRQIPPEEMLRIAKAIEEVSGILLDSWG